MGVLRVSSQLNQQQEVAKGDLVHVKIQCFKRPRGIFTSCGSV